MDYIQFLGIAAYRLETVLHRLHVMIAGFTLLGPAVASSFQTPEHAQYSIDTMLHYLHYYAAVGLVTHGAILAARFVLRKTAQAKGDQNGRNDG